MNKNPNVQALIDSLFPDHVNSSYPRLVEFAKAFFDYLETENKSGYYQNTLYYQRNVREQDPEFLEYIRRELGLYSARLGEADPKIFYDYLVDVWKSKGSKESVKAFFKLFLNDEITVIYPWESVLIPSDGRWIVESILRVVEVAGNPFDFAGKRIFQVGSSATAIVDSVQRKVYPGITIYELKLIRSTVSDSFSENGIIFANGTELEAKVCRTVTGIEISDGGSGYSIGDRVYFSDRTEVTFQAYVSAVNSSGAITEISITDFGYSNTPLSLITAGEYYLSDFEIFLNGTSVNSNGAATVDGSGTSASLSVTYGTLASSTGRYEGVKGQLSESIVLQDSRYYQKYSYEIRTAIPVDNWINPFKKIVHPSGMEVVANIITFNSLNVGIINIEENVVASPPDFVVTEETISITESRTIFSQDYFDEFYFASDYFGTTYT